MPAIVNLQCTRRLLYSRFWQLVRSTHNSHKLNVLIAAALRTPTNARCKESQLTSLVIDELIKRATIPRNEYQKIILCTGNDSDANETLAHIVKSLGLKCCESQVLEQQACSVHGLQTTLDNLSNGVSECIILGDIQKQAKIQQANATNALASELLSLRLQRREEQTEALGAAALVLTTPQTAERLQLHPLARICDLVVEPTEQQALLHACERQGIRSNDVQLCKMVTRYNGAEKALKVAHVTTHDVNKETTSHLLTHMAHSLPPGGFGCLLIEAAPDRHVLVMLEKLKPSIGKQLPQLTLYTKADCSLCDELVEQLEQSFPGAYELQKVYIDDKANVRYFRLYRYDIPVLFLNGQYLCMHRLNEAALCERLAALEQAK